MRQTYHSQEKYRIYLDKYTGVNYNITVVKKGGERMNRMLDERADVRREQLEKLYLQLERLELKDLMFVSGAATALLMNHAANTAGQTS